LLSRVVHGRSGSAISVHGLTISREYLKIRLRPRASERGSALGGLAGYSLPSIAMSNLLPSSLNWPPTGQVIRLRHGTSSSTDGPTDRRPSPTLALLDADRFTLDLTVRSWMPGDAFQPVGMGGHQKKLQDYFSDIKLPRPVRRQVPLLVAPEGILWIVGHRVDPRFGASSATARVIIAELVEEPPSSRN
ncbi:MAG: tRNA lysidine(34) synthetase TilS, partial [Anaerolineales bacterium]